MPDATGAEPLMAAVRAENAMSKSSQLSPSSRLIALFGLWLLVASSFGFLLAAIFGTSRGLQPWLLTLGPLTCAFIVFPRLRRRPPNEKVLP